jgi:hypothetical protein
MFNDLYEAPPNGFEHVIAVGEGLTKRLRAEPRLWAYLACAYGQKHAYSLQEEQVGAASDLRTIRDRALFCVRQAIDLDPSWRSELRLLWDPNAPKEPIENDLETFYSDAQFRAVIDIEAESMGRREVLASDISKTLLSFGTIPLIKYSGAVDVWVEDPKDGKKVSKLQSGMKYLLIVEFSSTLPQNPQGVSERIEVREGEVRNEVPFDLNPDATDIRFQPDKISVVVPHEGPPLRSRFEFTAPPRGASEIWLEIAQARRTIHMLEYPVAAS